MVWFYNACLAFGANRSVDMTMLVIHICAATASLVWMCIEWKRFDKPFLNRIVTRMVAGLATITLADAYIGVPRGLILGFFRQFIILPCC